MHCKPWWNLGRTWSNKGTFTFVNIHRCFSATLTVWSQSFVNCVVNGTLITSSFSTVLVNCDISIRSFLILCWNYPYVYQTHISVFFNKLWFLASRAFKSIFSALSCIHKPNAAPVKHITPLIVSQQNWLVFHPTSKGVSHEGQWNLCYFQKCFGLGKCRTAVFLTAHLPRYTQTWMCLFIGLSRGKNVHKHTRTCSPQRLSTGTPRTNTVARRQHTHRLARAHTSTLDGACGLAYSSGKRVCKTRLEKYFISGYVTLVEWIWDSVTSKQYVTIRSQRSRTQENIEQQR